MVHREEEVEEGNPGMTPTSPRRPDENPPSAAPPAGSGVVFTSMATGIQHDKDETQEEQEEGAKKVGQKQVTVTAPAVRQSMRAIVDEKEEITVSFENVTVYLAGDDNNSKTAACCLCNQLASPLASCAVKYFGVSVDARPSQYALTNVSGVIQSGEMVLVLSTADLYASTLIQAVTGRLVRQQEITGCMRLNGIPVASPQHWQGWRRKAPHVFASDTSHSPILTVQETVLFAAQCTNANDDNRQNEEQLSARVQRILQALDLGHVRDTVVGDENIRGVSGGQKRRVTIAEMMMDRHASFLGLENITDGLSSTDSYNLIAQLQQACANLKLSALVSLLQPSDEIVQLFDKILVLTHDGEMVYFGKVDREALRHVFLGPQADPAKEDTGSICDLVLGRQDEAILGRFQASQHYTDLMETTNQLRNVPASKRDLNRLLPAQKYATPWWYQFKTIGRRRLKLIARNAVTYTRIGIAIVFGLIIGSLFSELNNDLIGSLSRTGYMFLNCFLVLMLSAAITIPQTFRDRVTLFKHRSAEFYSGRIAYITNVLLDIPLSILEAIILASISYFWIGMKSGANHFFFFLGSLIGLEFFGQAFGRFLCAVSRKQVSANTMSSIFLLVFGTVAGFMPAYNAIPPVLRWLSWLTPASYAFEGLMINEFYGRNISAVALATDDGTVQLGRLPGSGWVGNFGLPRADWGPTDSIKVFDVMMLFVGALIIDIIGCYYVEHTRDWFFNQTVRPQRKAKSQDFDRPEKDSSQLADSGATGDPAGEPSEISPDWPQSLSIKDLSYYVELKAKSRPMRLSVESILGPCLTKCARKDLGKFSSRSSLTEELRELRLLDQVDATFRRGRIAALMGTSGAGKTTLLDVIAGYKTGGRITGEIMINGRSKETDIWRQISGYAEQMDILNPYLSTLETLRFTAACRLPSTFDMHVVIDDVVRLMKLEAWKDVIVGREVDGEGLPKHARKRLTIAVQLVTLPKILFADEPTTGLSTLDANLVMDAIRRSTDKMGLITVTTIHQPSKVIWDSFDDLVLLVRGGRLAYMGEIGKDSEKVLNHFKALSGQSPPAQVNPADYVLSAVATVSVEDAAAAFTRSKMNQLLTDQITAEKQEPSATHDEAVKLIRDQHRKGKSALTDFFLLTKRHFLTQWRNPSYSFMRLLSSVLLSLYMGVLFLSDKSSVQGAVFSIGALFFLVFLLVIPMQATVVPLMEDRAVLYRETSSGLYSRISYGLGQLAADIPFHAINTLAMFVCFYFLVEFKVEGDNIAYFILLLFLSNWVVMSLGQLFALATPNEESANGLAGLSVILSVILMGFLITVTAMPSYWEWAYWANLFHYIIQGFVTNELAGQEYALNLLDSGAAPVPQNVTSAFFLKNEADLSPGNVEQQGLTFLNLASQAGPGTNEQSGIGALAAWIACMTANDCLVEPLFENFVSCNIVAFPPPIGASPPCKDELNVVTETVDFEAIGQCLAPALNGTDSLSLSDGSGSFARGVPEELTEEDLALLSGSDELQILFCLLEALLPPGAVDEIVSILERAYNLGVFIVDVVDGLANLSIPGELILFVFGWADLEDGEFDAPYKWFYCMTSVAIFLAGIELFKLLAVRYVVWTKR